MTNSDETRDAIKLLPGNIEDGKLIYEEVCASCHQLTSHGDSTGTYPQLAGQHASVIIKQMVDIRAKNRKNPTMYSYSNIKALRQITKALFVQPKSDSQVLADVATYIQTLCMNPNTIKGPADNLEDGKRLYKKYCAECHLDHGQGSYTNYYPLLSGQNYFYLLRQFQWIKNGKRKNADQEMRRQDDSLTHKDIKAILAYASRKTMQLNDWPSTQRKFVAHCYQK